MWGNALLAFRTVSPGRRGEVSGEILELRLQQTNLHHDGVLSLLFRDFASGLQLMQFVILESGGSV